MTIGPARAPFTFHASRVSRLALGLRQVARRGALALRRLPRALAEGQGDAEEAPAPLGRLDPEPAPVPLDDAPADVEAQAEALRATVRGVARAVEGQEDVVAVDRRHPDAVVAHAQQRLIALPPRLDDHLAAGGRVLERVLQQVGEDLPQAQRVVVAGERLRGVADDPATARLSVGPAARLLVLAARA